MFPSLGLRLESGPSRRPRFGGALGPDFASLRRRRRNCLYLIIRCGAGQALLVTEVDAREITRRFAGLNGFVGGYWVAGRPRDTVSAHRAPTCGRLRHVAFQLSFEASSRHAQIAPLGAAEISS